MIFKGIDISYANKGIDFKKIKAEGISFVIIRTGYRQKTDDMFKSHIENALAAGLNVGVYCYCLAKTPAEAVKEADYVIELIKPYKLTYPVCYDMEDSAINELDKKELTEIAFAFLNRIKKAGYHPALYSNPSWLEYRLDKKKLLDSFDLWLAHWTGDPDIPSKYDFGQKMWQWGADRLNGSAGALDGDLSYVDYPAIIAAENSPEPEKGFVPEKGETVLFSGGKHYASSAAAVNVGNIRTAGTAKVTLTASGAIHPYHLIGESSDVYGWVDKNAVFEKNSGEIRKSAAVVNLRSKAGTDGKILTVIPPETRVILFDETVSNEGILWQKAAYNGYSGYLNSAFIYG